MDINTYTQQKRCLTNCLSYCRLGITFQRLLATVCNYQSQYKQLSSAANRSHEGIYSKNPESDTVALLDLCITG